MNKTFHNLPIPEILDGNLNHSFKFNQPDNRKNKKPPKLVPKENSYRQVHHEVHVVSFNDSSNSPQTITPDRHSSFNGSSCYNRSKSNSYFDQCFDQLSKLGEGSFGEVFQVRSREDGNLYAVKKTKQFYRSENHRKERLEEVRRYQQFSNSEHCIRFYKAWEQDDLLYIQVELCRGSVEDYVAEQKKVSEDFAWSFLLDMLTALKGFHERNLVHLDVKLDNIMITDDNSCKLGDFGLVLDLTNSARSKALEGDSRYLAPELLQGNYCLANDVFSLGVALLELSSNLELPSNGLLWQELRSGRLPETALAPLSIDLQSIIREMMEPDPAKRPTVIDLMQNSVLKRMIISRKIKQIRKRVAEMSWKGVKKTLGFFVTMFTMISNFFILDKTAHQNDGKGNPELFINIYNEKNESFQDTSFRTFPANDSNRSNISRTDDDNNNDSNNTTPTLNNQIPRISTPEIKIVNSTPLNHFNHQNGLSNRKFRRDLTKSSFDTTAQLSFNQNSTASERDSIYSCKKLCFQDDDFDDV